MFAFLGILIGIEKKKQTFKCLALKTNPLRTSFSHRLLAALN